MATSPVPIEQFSGLNLVDDVETLGPSQAVDVLNVDLSLPGRLRTRPGTALIYSQTSGSVTNIAFARRSAQVLISVSATQVRVINVATGTLDASLTLGTESGAAFSGAGPSGNVYIGRGSSLQVARWDGAAFTSPAGLAAVRATLLANQPKDDRLVAVDAVTSPSRVSFSNAGAPETFGANDWVDLDPGDAQQIVGLAVWNSELYVFKESKFYVFYGNSVDRDGNPVFNYRTVNTGVGALAHGTTGCQLVAAHPSGVYFVSNTGVYRTTGGPPVCVSNAIAPLFEGNDIPMPSTFTGITSAKGQGGWRGFGIAGDRLYLSDGAATMVYDIRRDLWLCWSVGIYGFAATPAWVASSEFVWGGVNALGTTFFLNRLYRTLTDDSGTAISWLHTSGMTDLGYPGQVKITLESRVWGSGTVTLQVANDHGAVDTGSALTLGTSPAVVDVWQQIDREGTFFQNKLSGSGQAVVHRLVHYVSFVKPSGVG